MVDLPSPLVRNCEEPIGDDVNNSHALKDLCLKCSKRHRNIASSTDDKQALQWFQALRTSNVVEYRRVMSSREEHVPEVKRGMRSHKSKFDLFQSLWPD